MLDTLRAFSDIYLRSAAGRGGGGRDYTIGYEEFLRKAGLDDGEEREIAERELRLAEQASAGMLRIDRHLRTGDPVRLRLAAEGGEAWLFAKIGGPSPSAGREALARFFEEAARAAVPRRWDSPWREWFAGLAVRALSGESVQPFRRDDAPGNLALLEALRGVLHWEGGALVRYASAAICGDSKALQALEPRLRPALGAITGEGSLEAFGIVRKPRSVTFHGSLAIEYPDRVVDFSVLPAPVSLFEENLTSARRVVTAVPLCLTVENEDVFHELARRNPGILLVQSSFAGAAALRLLRLIPAEVVLYHFGDSDPAGSEILRDLRERVGRPIRPLLMGHRPAESAVSLTARERRILERLLSLNMLEDLHDDLARKLASGEKGDFEQEHLPVEEVLREIARVMV